MFVIRLIRKAFALIPALAISALLIFQENAMAADKLIDDVFNLPKPERSKPIPIVGAKWITFENADDI